MRKYAYTVFLSVFLFSFIASGMSMINAHSFYFTKSDGEFLYLSEYKDKVLLVVNTASECGLTSQYKELQELYDEYKDRGFEIVAVPANDFGNQEPGDQQHIENFVATNFNISFTLVQKESVKGENAHPFYSWAGDQVGFFGKPKWNFHKYLIGKDGELIDWFASTTLPTSPKLKKVLESVL